MSLYQNMNQFSMTALKGKIAAGPNGNTLSVQIAANSVATLKPGDFVKLVDVAANTVVVDIAAATDAIVGCVLFSPKKDLFVALDTVEIALNGSIVNLESAGAIARGADVEYTPTGTLVTTTGGTNTIVGVALDKASGANKIVRVLLKGTFAFSPTITGGTINSTPIGGSTPAAGAFTTIAASGNVAFAAKATAKVLGSLAAVVVTPGATPAIDATLGKVFTVVPAEHEAFTTTGGVVGQEIILQVTTSGTNSYNLSFNTGFGANAGTLATGTVTAKVFVLKFIHNGTSFVEVSRTAAM